MSNEFVIYKTDNLAGGLNFKADSWVGAPNGLKPNEAIFCKNCSFWDGVSVRSRNGFYHEDTFSLSYSPNELYYVKVILINGEFKVFFRTKVFDGVSVFYVNDYLQDTGILQNVVYSSGMEQIGIGVYNDILYILDNVASKKWDGSNLTNLGITAPTTSCTAATGTAGSLTGTYVYYYSFYNSTTNTESALSPASGVVSPTAQRVNLASVSVSSDSQVDQRRIYRQGSSSDVIFYCGVINDNVSTTYTDNTATLTVEQDCSDNGVLGGGNVATIHHHQLFAAGQTGKENYLFYSRYYQPESFPDYYYTIVNQNDTIVDIRPLGIDLIIYTKLHIYRYRYIGLDEGDSIIEEIAHVGCLERDTLVTATIDGKDSHIFLGISKEIVGVFIFDGVRILSISKKFDPFFTNVSHLWAYSDYYDISKACFCNGTYYLPMSGYMPSLLYEGSGSGVVGTGWILKFDISNYVSDNGVVIADMSDMAFDRIFTVPNLSSSTRQGYSLGGISSDDVPPSYGYEYYLESPSSTSDDGIPIAFVYQTGYFGDRNVYATLRTITFNADTDGEDLTIKIYCDYTVKATLTCNTSSMERVELSAPSTCYGKLFSIRFEFSSSTGRITISPPLELKVSQWRRY